MRRIGFKWINKKLLMSAFIILLCFKVFGEDRWSSSEINVRTGPGISYDVMGQLYKNEKVEVFNTVNGWAQIIFENIEGYVNEDLLLFERIKTPEEEKAVRIAAELEKKKQEKERLISRIKQVLVIFIGIIGTIIIFIFFY